MALSSMIASSTRGFHVFKIIGYSKGKGIGTSNYIQSNMFTVGGFDWCLRFYPDGSDKGEDCKYISVFLELLNLEDEVKAMFDITLIDENGNYSVNYTSECSEPQWFKGSNNTLGFPQFMKRDEFEGSEFLKNDELTINCHVFVVEGSKEKAKLGESLGNVSIN